MLMKHLILLSLIFAPLISFATADTITSPVNNKSIIINDASEFSFLVVGHAYGKPSSSIFPSPSLLANIDKINTSEASFLLLLGDNYRQLDSLNVSIFKSTFIDKLEIPVFIAIGNHDLTPNHITNYYGQDYPTFRKEFGADTYYSFVISSTLFIILDSELSLTNGRSDGSIKGDQLDFLKKTLDKFLTPTTSIRNIFIGAHKKLDLWKNNFHSEVYPLFSKADSIDVAVYLLSGDLAASTPDFYIKTPKDSIATYIHTHLNDTKHDKMLQFNVAPDGLVKITPLSLTGLPIKSINSSTFDTAPESVPIGKKIKYYFSNREFLIGVLFTVIAIMLILGFWKTKRFLTRNKRH